MAAAAALALAWTIANVAADPDHRARPLAKSIAGELTSPSMAGVNVGDVTSALSSLQNVLQTAQSLVPGGASAAASALASTSQFATLFGNLLSDAGSLGAAASTLYEIAQQLQAIATAFTAAAQGNP